MQSGDIGGANHFSDKRVRRALYQALDIEAIRDDVMAGFAIPPGMTIPPGVNGYAPELDQRICYDPEQAKALLAEAGYPEAWGSPSTFPTTITSTTRRSAERWPRQLDEIGVRVKADARPKELHFAKIFERRTDFLPARLSNPDIRFGATLP